MEQTIMTGIIDQYLAELRRALSGMTVSEREEIVDEIRAHIAERRAQPGIAAGEVLRRLGPAEEIARDYTNGALLRRANRSRSPWFLLWASYHWAKTGVQGLAIFFLALVGYVCGAEFVICAFLKPLFPDNIGLWVGQGGINFGFPESVQGRTELLGPWFTQISILIGIGFLIVTTIAVRALLPKLKNSRRLAQGATKIATTA
jgi:uncharacterized membrane protein